MRLFFPLLFSFSSKYVHGKQMNHAKVTTRSYHPSNTHQLQYFQYLQDPSYPICLGVGPAGTGKTMFACLAAIDALNSGKIKKIVLTRSILPVQGEELGFLPGDIHGKMKPWIQPIFDVFLEHYDVDEVAYMIRKEIIEIAPLAFMRGRTFKHSYIIADEIQNTTPEQVFMLATRLGENAKLIITGDLDQSDLGPKNGLQDFLQRLKTPTDGISLTQFHESDVLRSPIVKTVLQLYKDKRME